jgi:hypothetical protein
MCAGWAMYKRAGPFLPFPHLVHKGRKVSVKRAFFVEDSRFGLCGSSERCPSNGLTYVTADCLFIKPLSYILLAIDQLFCVAAKT